VRWPLTWAILAGVAGVANVRCERATLTYESFDARGIGDLVTGSPRRRLPYPSALADAFAASAALARDPSIDPERIAFLGLSFGGEVAHDAAFERLRGKLGECRQRFATMSPITRPGCTGWSPLQQASGHPA
jgi:alpha/beta hydrolase family protein